MPAAEQAAHNAHNTLWAFTRRCYGYDLALGIIGQIGTDGATGHVIEYGEAIRSLSMEGRMTLCNMSIEAGAQGGHDCPDETTFNYLKGRRFRSQRRKLERGSRILANA